MKLNHDLTIEQTKEIGDSLGVNWDEIDIEQFKRGLLVELEHGTVNPKTNITDDDAVMTAKIALAHLQELPDYYTLLQNMEMEAEQELAND